MFFRCAKKWDKTNRATIKFHRVESAFQLERDTPPILSIYRAPGSRGVPRYVQIGFPKLPEAGSQIQFELLRAWLRTCDNTKTHSCHPALEGTLPTRVLDVGTAGSPNVLRLHCSSRKERGRYIALSHRWGPYGMFSTIKENLAAFLKSIEFDELPKTFQDAVFVTRQLGIRFLWIDSLCIVQDDREDWEKQSKLMEDVFQSAYCTIAATKGSFDGFLTPRRSRKVVAMKSNLGGSYYICETIDDFHSDVEEGELNKRGWVLQERVLSHRTIHFTATQLYWECGNGVQCETLTKLHK